MEALENGQRVPPTRIRVDAADSDQSVQESTGADFWNGTGKEKKRKFLDQEEESEDKREQKRQRLTESDKKEKKKTIVKRRSSTTDDNDGDDDPKNPNSASTSETPSQKPTFSTKPRESLPWAELQWGTFEKICSQLCEKKFGESMALYGVPGQSQEGVDALSDDRQVAIQCKHRKQFGPKELDDAINKFKTGKLFTEVKIFILAVSIPVRNTQSRDKWSKFSKEMSTNSMKVHLWDQNKLEDELRTCPDLVTIHFGDKFSKDFCVCNYANFSELEDLSTYDDPIIALTCNNIRNELTKRCSHLNLQFEIQSSSLLEMLEFNQIRRTPVSTISELTPKFAKSIFAEHVWSLFNKWNSRPECGGGWKEIIICLTDVNKVKLTLLLAAWNSKSRSLKLTNEQPAIYSGGEFLKKSILASKDDIPLYQGNRNDFDEMMSFLQNSGVEMEPISKMDYFDQYVYIERWYNHNHARTTYMIETKCTSYGLKHLVEQYSKPRNVYISNASMKLYLLHRGHELRLCPPNNLYANIAWEEPTHLQETDGFY